MIAARMCCERCPGATAANTSHIARRRLLKAAVFRSEIAGHSLNPTLNTTTASPDDARALDTGVRADHTAALETSDASWGRNPNTWQLRAAPATSTTSSDLYRSVTGTICDISPHFIAIGNAREERRFALTADATAWRGGPLEPSALKPGDEAVIRLVPTRDGVADRIWANIGRVSGVILRTDDDGVLVSEGATRRLQTIVIPPRASSRIQVRFPNLRPGYLIDVIGIRRQGVLEGLIPATTQPRYLANEVTPYGLSATRAADAITGTAVWHDSADEPYGVLGAFYPAVDPAAGCAENKAAGAGTDKLPAYRELPYLAVGTALYLYNECTRISLTLPVAGCAPTARLFDDHCVACRTSPRGRIADLTLASFVALGGELEDGCFNATIGIGR